MIVCITKKGTDPDECLRVAYPDNADRDRIRAADLPWCLGPFTAAVARAVCEGFTDYGGAASIVESCADCRAVDVD
jgi:hypothetical protein